MNKYIIYNPFAYLPYFRFELVEKIQDENGNLNDRIEIVNDKIIFDLKDEVKITKKKINFSNKIFFISFELVASFIMFIWSAVLFLSTRTDIYSLGVFLIGFTLSCILVMKKYFIIANIIISVTAILCLISLYVYYHNIELIFQHLGILFFALFFINSIFYRIIKKLNLIQILQSYYATKKNGKGFAMLKSDKDEIPSSWKFTKKMKENHENN